MITKFKNKYDFLSNFYKIDVQFRGVTYYSSEHAYMSAKSDDPKWKEECRTNPSPGAIKRKSKDVKLVDNWDDIKIDVMREVLSQKFETVPHNKEHSLINRMLLETYGEELMEGNLWGDKFWGVDEKTLKGENHLGKLLMERREELYNIAKGRFESWVI